MEGLGRGKRRVPRPVKGGVRGGFVLTKNSPKQGSF